MACSQTSHWTGQMWGQPDAHWRSQRAQTLLVTLEPSLESQWAVDSLHGDRMWWIDVSLHGVLEKQIGHRHQGHTHQHTGQASKGKETGKSLCREGRNRYRATPDTVGRLRTHDQSLEGTMEAGGE